MYVDGTFEVIAFSVYHLGFFFKARLKNVHHLLVLRSPANDIEQILGLFFALGPSIGVGLT